MLRNIDTEKAILFIECVCGTKYESPYEKGSIKQFNEEFNEYQNHITESCPDCGSAMFINMNVPMSELADEFIDLHNMAQHERIERRVMREFMRSEEID